MREAWATAGAVEPAAGEVEGAGKLGPSFGAGAGCGVGLGVGLIGGSTPPLNPRPACAAMEPSGICVRVSSDDFGIAASRNHYTNFVMV